MPQIIRNDIQTLLISCEDAEGDPADLTLATSVHAVVCDIRSVVVKLGPTAMSSATPLADWGSGVVAWPLSAVESGSVAVGFVLIEVKATFPDGTVQRFRVKDRWEVINPAFLP
jgi:hypothetical protein